MSSVRSKWLIKSENTILGPYSTEQVEELLLKSQISLIDEIRDMSTRWSYIREIDVFKGIVETIRNQNSLNAEQTRTLQTTTQQTGSNKLDTVTPFQTEKSNMISFENISVSTPTQVDFKEQNYSQTTAVSKTVSYSSESNHDQRKKKMYLGLAGLFIIGVLVGINQLYNYQKGTDADKKQISLLKKYVYQDRLDDAKSIFISLNKDLKNKALPEIIPLLLYMEKKSPGSTDDYINRMQKSIDMYSNEVRSQIELVNFYKSYKKNDYGQASQNVIRSLNYEPLSIAANENDALLYFSQRKFPEAAKKYAELYDRQIKGRFLMMSILSKIYLSDGMIIKNSSDLLLKIDSHLLTNIDYKKELLFLKMYILSKETHQNTKELDKAVNDYINFPFHISKNFYIEPLTYADFYNPQLLTELQNSFLNQSLIKDNRLFELQVHFLIEQNELPRALQFLDTNRPSFSEDSYLSYQVQILNLIGDRHKANTLLNQRRTKGYKDTFMISVSYLNTTNQEKGLSSYLSGIQTNDGLFADWSDLQSFDLKIDRERFLDIFKKNKDIVDYFIPLKNAKSRLNE